MIRVVAALAISAVVGLTAMVAPPAASAAAPATVADDGLLPVTVEITGLTPQALQPGDDLTITATLHNEGPDDVVEPQLRVLLDTRSYISRSSLDRWREREPTDPAGFAVLTVDLDEPLPAGGSVATTTTVPAADLGLTRSARSWGPRGIAVEVVDRADPARARLGLARTFVIWFPEQEVTATRLSVLVPVVGPPPDPFGATWVEDLDRLTGPDGRLGALLAATGEHRGVTWAVDPWLVEATAEPTTDADGGPAEQDQQDQQSGLGEGDERVENGVDEGAVTDPGSAVEDGTGDDAGSDAPLAEEAPSTGDLAVAGEDARAWTRSLIDAMTDRDVQLLPYGDSDLAALAHTGADGLLRTAFDRARTVAETSALPDGADMSIAWPVEQLPDLTTAAFGTDGGERALVVGPGELPPPDVLTYTPTGRTTVDTAAGEVTVLVPDGRLSEALRGGQVPTMDGEVAPVDPQLTPATATQDLLAELAVITRERPSDARHLLVTLPRDWQPDPRTVRAQLDALEEVPWVRLESIAALIGADADGPDRGTLPEREVQSAEVSSVDLEAVRSAVDERVEVAQMAEDPERLLGDTEAELLAVASAAWRDDPLGRAAVVARSEARTEALRGTVEVQQGSSVNLTSATGELPVRVSNALDQPVTVAVTLRPGDSRLVVDEIVTVTVPARSDEAVQVPVHAIQSADVAVTVELRTLGGTLLDDSTQFEVRVRAEWEGIGTAVLGALLAIGLVIGLVRTIRRGRGGRRAAPITSGPDALSPEWTASSHRTSAVRAHDTTTDETRR